MLKILNTLSGEKEPFTPIEPNKAGIYTCGPTVYGAPHIGNLRAYIFSDTLRRTLEYLGYEVKQIINITDVGHLVGDTDSGEDKLEKGARTAGKTVWEMARGYEAEFIGALKKLNVEMPGALPRATEHIREQLAMIKTLSSKGFTYETSDGIYFDTSKFKDYGRLSGQRLEEKEAGARVEIKEEKKHPADFALWKLCVGDNFNHTMRWDFESGEDLSAAPHLSEEENRAKKIGFPGWHIECSAMSVKYLGERFDIHTGGVDHIPVHHENEIAQSEAALGHPFVNYWMHNEFILVDGGKMSKSLGNTYTLADLKEKWGISPMVFRYFCLGAHYRSKLNFTKESIEAAQNGYLRLLVRIIELRQTAVSPISESDQEKLVKERARSFEDAISDDLNTPKALAVAFDTLRDNTLSSESKLRLVGKFDTILGLNLMEESQKEFIKTRIDDKLDAAAIKLSEEREEARKIKDFAKADEIRDQLASLGYLVEDTPEGPRVTKI